MRARRGGYPGRAREITIKDRSDFAAGIASTRCSCPKMLRFREAVSVLGAGAYRLLVQIVGSSISRSPEKLQSSDGAAYRPSSLRGRVGSGSVRRSGYHGPRARFRRPILGLAWASARERTIIEHDLERSQCPSTLHAQNSNCFVSRRSPMTDVVEQYSLDRAANTDPVATFS